MDSKNKFQRQKVALGDMDCVLKLEDQKLINQRIGHIMWRSSEEQLGKSVEKPSELLSYALLVS